MVNFSRGLVSNRDTWHATQPTELPLVEALSSKRVLSRSDAGKFVSKLLSDVASLAVDHLLC